jgi:glucosamine--fructose-6-phosphate aminotransferase (isomerizing)
MCGIIAGIYDNIYKILLDGLLQLQNRGYDSAGIAIIDENIKCIKKASTSTLSAIDYLNTNHIRGNIGIGHTRWATHGEKNDINSHPHISMCEKFALVHNGIIENYKELKTMLLENGYIMSSQTDTEIIVNLLSFYNKENNIEQSIQQVINKLEGTWGLVIMNVDYPNTLYATRNGSPLLIGYNETNVIITSEQSGFNNKLSNYFVLNNNDICIIKKQNENIIIDTKDNYTLKKINYLNTEINGFDHWMIKEIFEQEQTIMNVLKRGSRLLENNKVRLGGLNEKKKELENIDNIILLGCGTSFNACCYGIHFFKDLCKFNSIQVLDGADFSNSDIPKKGHTCLILLSQSGETKDLHRCIAIAREYELFTIGLVNVVDSLIAREVDCGCYLHAGREVAVASTKSFTSQSILLVLISIWFSQTYYPHENIKKREKIIQDLYNLQYDIKKTLNVREHIKKLVPLFNKNSCFILGKQKGEPIAKEGALKIKEVSYIHAEGYSTSSLKHGPFALLEEDFPVILLNPNDEFIAKTQNAYEEIKSRHARIIKIVNNGEQGENIINIPYNHTFSHLLMIIPLQLLSYELSIFRKINPDMPRNLAKVVTVE